MTSTHTAYTDTDTLIRLLDAAEAMPAAARLRARSYQLLRLPPDATVVDVGCGAARAVAELAEHAAHALRVDPGPAMLAGASRRTLRPPPPAGRVSVWAGAGTRVPGGQGVPFPARPARGPGGSPPGPR